MTILKAQCMVMPELLFRFGTKDPILMANEMYLEFDVEDYINLPNYKIYLKLMIDGKLSSGF
ncbi:MAG: hypothetical protein IPO86_06820 [Saprospiraceae bacterium]|nr:hypothetical protein [Saprospiraceae bacterium]MBK9727814.1 hypothetical protein [Saprospiraceae bacterium]